MDELDGGMNAGVRPVSIGLLAGGVLGAALALPVIGDKRDQLHDVEEGRSDPHSSAPRRIAGFAANFALPATLFMFGSRAGIGHASRGALLAATAAIPGAYWGARQLADA